MKTLTVLGSTGSIGANTLDVVRHNRHRFQVYALAAGQNADLLSSQIREFRPKVAVVATSDALARLTHILSAAMEPNCCRWTASTMARTNVCGRAIARKSPGSFSPLPAGLFATRLGKASLP